MLGRDEPPARDVLVQSTESDRFGYFASPALIGDAILSHALDEIDQSGTFAYLPAVSLTLMQPATAGRLGWTIGSLTVFRGGRVQWQIGDFGSLDQDWRVPHLYGDRAVAMELCRLLLDGAVERVARHAWRIEQTKLCPVCGHDLAHHRWERSSRDANALPPMTVPPYGTCEGCNTTFGVDWIGLRFSEMRELWLARQGKLTPDQRERLKRTPTDDPTSALAPGSTAPPDEPL
jgi:hypothetical protein